MADAWEKIELDLNLVDSTKSRLKRRASTINVSAPKQLRVESPCFIRLLVSPGRETVEVTERLFWKLSALIGRIQCDQERELFLAIELPSRVRLQAFCLYLHHFECGNIDLQTVKPLEHPDSTGKPLCPAPLYPEPYENAEHQQEHNLVAQDCSCRQPTCWRMSDLNLLCKLFVASEIFEDGKLCNTIIDRLATNWEQFSFRVSVSLLNYVWSHTRSASKLRILMLDWIQTSVSKRTFGRWSGWLCEDVVWELAFRSLEVTTDEQPETVVARSRSTCAVYHEHGLEELDCDAGHAIEAREGYAYYGSRWCEPLPGSKHAGYRCSPPKVSFGEEKLRAHSTEA